MNANTTRAVLLRVSLFGGFWVLLAGPWGGQTADLLADLAVGALAVGLAA